MVSLSIIIVNYKSIHLISACLQSIHQYCTTQGLEILIIDNSADDPQPILQQFPQVQWVPMGYNAGFARANNKGIQLAKADTVLLLNPDVLVEDDAITKCYRQFNSSEFIACGVQLLNPDRTPQISGSYFMKGGLNHLLLLPFSGKMVKWLGERKLDV